MTPSVLETTKALAGIANAERIAQQTRDKAELMLLKMLDVINQDVEEAHAAATSTIIKPLSLSGQA